MIGRMAIATAMRERTDEENLAHDKELLNERVKQKAAERRHAAQLSLDDRWFPMYGYLYAANFIDYFTSHHHFETYILTCIIVASVLVGIEQYPEMSGIYALYMLESIVMHSFIVEALLKIWAQGDSPWYYFIGNEGPWNTFDFTIVLLANPYIDFTSGADGLEIFRLVRLMRLVKVFRKIPQLRMILMGLIGGLKSIVYIVVLMALTFYLYGLMGIIIFRDSNDPWHFKTVAVSMLTLLRVATLDGWGNIFYINYLGCDVYPNIYYYSELEQVGDQWPPIGENNVGTEAFTSYQGFGRIGEISECTQGVGRPVLTTMYFMSFIILASFCMLSLFVGAVSMSMSESMEKMQEEKEEARKKERRGQLEAEIERLSHAESIERRVRSQVLLLKQAFTGLVLDPEAEAYEEKQIYKDQPWKLRMKEFCRLCGRISDHSTFQRFVTAAIILAGIQVGLGTFEWMNHYNYVKTSQDTRFDWWTMLDYVIVAIFWFELVLKIIAEEGRLQHVFKYSWNCFDAFVLIMTHSVSGNAVLILRLLRLLRVLKLMRALPQLQVIIEALMNGISSIGFISVLLGIFFFFFGVIGKIIFADNDPWHFGTLHMSIVTLFQLATLDDWTIVMYINLYGCDVYGGGYYEDGLFCDPQYKFGLTAFYFIIFILVGALVLFTLFIGVVSMSFDEAQTEQKAEAAINVRVLKFADQHDIGSDQLALYREVFALVDFTGSSEIGKQELKFGLKLAEMDITEAQFELLWARLDKDNSDGVDMAEFLDFMVALRVEIMGARTLRQERTPMFHMAGESHKAKPLPMDTSQTGKSFLTLHTGTSKGKVVPVETEDDYTMTHHTTASVHTPGDDRSRLVDMGAGASPSARRPLPRLSVAGQLKNRLESHVSEGSDEDSEYLETVGPHTILSTGPSESSEREMALQVVATVQRQVEQLTASAREQMDHYHEHQQAALEMEVQRIQGSEAPGSPSKYVVSRQDAKRVAVKAQEVAETAAALARKAAAILEQANAYSAVSHDGQSLMRGNISALSPVTKSDIQQRYATLQSKVNESLRSTRNMGVMPEGVSPSADHWGDYARSTGRGVRGSPDVGSVGTANQDGSPSDDGDGDTQRRNAHRAYSPQRAAGMATMVASRSESALHSNENGFLVPPSLTSGSGGDVLGDVEMQQGRNAARPRAGTPVLATPVKPAPPAVEHLESDDDDEQK